jgi:hypothetical protein
MAMTLQKLVNLHEDSEDDLDEEDAGEKLRSGVHRVPDLATGWITGWTSVEEPSPSTSITIRKGRTSLWTRMFKTLFPTSHIIKKDKERDL